MNWTSTFECYSFNGGCRSLRMKEYCQLVFGFLSICVSRVFYKSFSWLKDGIGPEFSFIFVSNMKGYLLLSKILKFKSFLNFYVI